MNFAPVCPRACRLTLVFAGVVLLAGTAMARTFKSAEGASIEAEVVLVRDGNVTLLRSDGRRFTHPLSFFSREDQAALAPGATPAAPPPGTTPSAATTPAAPTVKTPLATATPPVASGKPYLADVRVSSGKSDRLSQAEYFDDRLLRLRFQVDITSRETTRELVSAKGTLIVLGKSVVDSREYGVLGREEFPVEILSIRKPFHFDAKTITTEYDDKGSGSKYGFRYLGYVFVLQESGGAIVRADASPEGNAKLAQKALGLQVGQVLDKNLDPIKGATSTTVRVR